MSVGSHLGTSCPTSVVPPQCLFLSIQACTPPSCHEAKHTRTSSFDPITSSGWDSISLLFTVKFLPLVGISDASVAWSLLPSCFFFFSPPPPQHTHHTQTLFVRIYKYASETGGLVVPSDLMPNLKILLGPWHSRPQSSLLPFCITFKNYTQTSSFTFAPYYYEKPSVLSDRAEDYFRERLVTSLKMVAPGCSIGYVLPPCHFCPAVDTAPSPIPHVPADTSLLWGIIMEGNNDKTQKNKNRKT